MRRLLLALAAPVLMTGALAACASSPDVPQGAGGAGQPAADGGGDDGSMVDAAGFDAGGEAATGDGSGDAPFDASGDGAPDGADDDASGNADGSGDATSGGDAFGDASGDGASGDGGSSLDGSSLDGGPGEGDAAGDASSVGVITGGPCLSGAPGATAFRIQWVDAGGTAQVDYEVDGLPEHSQDTAGAYGYQIGFTPQFVDPYLGEGGLQLDDSDFVDLQLTTVGITSITSATLSIYGRSYSVDTSGSFNWQTFDGTGQTPTDFVSNVAPYQWYSADMTAEIGPGESNVLIRIKAGPSSDAIVVNRIELCMFAQ